MENNTYFEVKEQKIIASGARKDKSTEKRVFFFKNMAKDLGWYLEERPRVKTAEPKTYNFFYPKSKKREKIPRPIFQSCLFLALYNMLVIGTHLTNVFTVT